MELEAADFESGYVTATWALECGWEVIRTQYVLHEIEISRSENRVMGMELDLADFEFD